VWTREEILRRAATEPQRLADDVLVLQARLEDLEARLAQTSANSSKPPASDGLRKPAPKSQRERGTRPRGGQRAHPGHTLQPVATPDAINVLILTHCPCGCGSALGSAPVLGYETRQVFELPPQRLIVTEHRAEIKRCPVSGCVVRAPFPAGVSAPAQYGPQLCSWLVYLRVNQLLPLRRIRQVAADLFGCSVSEATIERAAQRIDHALPGFEGALIKTLLRCPVVHADESGVRVNSKLHWLHVLCSERFTWYAVHPRRGRVALADFGILKNFSGRLMHDCWQAYFDLACPHGLCNAHLVRELIFLHEECAQDWAAELKDLLLLMHRQRALWTATGVVPTAAQLTAWHARYQTLLTQGLSEQPAPVRVGTRGRLRQSRAHNLLARLQKHQASVLAFLRNPAVPFTNNQAEQDIRMLKVQQKISGCFRTLQAAKTFARIRAYISTVRKHGLGILSALQDALAGNPFHPYYSGP